MCLFAAGFIDSFRLPPTNQRSPLRRRSIGVLLPSLLPIAASTTTVHVDYGAHFGGAITGVIVGFWLLKTWLDTARLPRLSARAGGIAVVGMFLMTAS
jgi:rhomboid protease GluP